MNDVLVPFLIEKTLELARSSVDRGNHPFGAILANRGEVIATAENTVCTDQDVTAHAEMNLIRKVKAAFPGLDLGTSVLYSSTEPCAMCCGAIYWAGIGSVVFGCSNERLSEVVGGTLEIPSAGIFKRGQRMVKVAGPVGGRAFESIHEKFWRQEDESNT